MNPRIINTVILLIIACGVSGSCTAEETAVGLESRIPWVNSRIKGSPEPTLPYIADRAFPNLSFNHCLDITSAPGSDRLFVVEQGGKIFSFPNRQDIETPDLVIDFAREIPGLQQVYSLVFHPEFEKNQFCFVCYINAPDQPDGTHIARFQMSSTEPPTIDAKSEATILTFRSGGHNGCCLKFSPEGYLYISTGDGGPANPPDILKTGQNVTDLLSCILRVDVDHVQDGLNYRIPVDNPFVNLPSARGEIWAYGLRNPWRISVDRRTGDLWVGDVGWELWEMLNRVERGGNYGWAVTEGRQSTHPEWNRGPTPILPPTIDHSHTESSSITEGLTYYGSRLKDLYGTHIYSDYDTGKFWSFRYQNGQVVDHHEIADTTLRVAGFGEDREGEFYVLDHAAGTIHRLIHNPSPDQSATFPRKLSETGLFLSVCDQSPSPGVIPYSINAEAWADFARADRYVAIPSEQTISPVGGKWAFPADSVLVKTLAFDSGDPIANRSRRIETQILHFDGTDWLPYSYRWNNEQTDAVLVESTGAEATIEIPDSTSIEGKRTQNWRFFGRAECQRCHNTWSGPALAFNQSQLNRVHKYDNKSASQVPTLVHAKIIDPQLVADKSTDLVDPHESSASLDVRARSYLHVNCAHCHRMHAGGAVLSQMQFELPLDKTMMVGIRPTQGTFGIHAAHVVSPGDPARSVLVYRMSKLGGGRMPYLGSSEIDRRGIDLIHEWIQQLPAELATDKSGHDSSAHLRLHEVSLVNQLRNPGSETESRKQIKELLANTSGAMLVLRSLERGELPASVRSIVTDSANEHREPTVRDLFERFLPTEKRVKRLGANINPKQILAMSGDPVSGKRMFFETASVACKNCHRIQKEGKEIGPDLTLIGKKLGRLQLLESILEPSKTIDPKYVTYLAETEDGRTLTGLLMSRDDAEVVLKDAQDNLIRIQSKALEQLVPQRQSLMPELLIRDMTAQQVADLLEFLVSLK